MITPQMVNFMIFNSDYLVPESGEKACWGQVWDRLRDPDARAGYPRFTMYMQTSSSWIPEERMVDNGDGLYIPFSETAHSRATPQELVNNGLDPRNRYYWFSANLVAFTPSQGISSPDHDDSATSMFVHGQSMQPYTLDIARRASPCRC